MDGSKETAQDSFVRVLKVEPRWAIFLLTSGFRTLEEVAYVLIDEFRSIDGLGEQQIRDWRARSRRHLLVEAIGGGDEEDPLVTAAVEPPKPMSGGSAAKMHDSEDRDHIFGRKA